MNPYEAPRMLAEYLLFHYGTAAEILPWESGPRDALHFPVRAVAETIETGALPKNARALDLGCAVGRSSFELARHCAEVIGIDFSASFIAACETLRNSGQLAFDRVDEGILTTPLIARVPAEIDRERVRFEVGDACNLRGDLGGFDVVLLANLIDRLPDPAACLERLPSLVNPGGQLIITSPYTWLTDYTPPGRWLGGSPEKGGTLAALQTALAPAFVFAGAVDLPFLIREHARKFQWSVAQASRWRRKA